MGRGTNEVAESVVGADGARYRRGRRKLLTPDTAELPEILTLTKLTHSGNEQLKFLKALSANLWTVEDLPGLDADGRSWLVTAPDGEILEQCWSATDGLDSAILQIRSSENGGRVRVIGRDGHEAVYSGKGRQNGWCDPLAPMQFELAEKRSQLASIAPYRPRGYKLYVTKIGMTISRVPQELEDQFEHLLDGGFTCSLQPIPVDDPICTTMRLRINWNRKLV